MKNFRLPDSSELLAIRLVLTYWAQKCLIPTFYTWCTSSWWKILISPIRASWWLLDSFWPPEPKSVWFLLSRHDVRRVHEKFSSLRFERAIDYKTRFDLLSPKTFDSYFLDMMYVEFMKNFLLSDSSELLTIRLVLTYWAQEAFDSYLLGITYVEFMKNFLLADSSELLASRLILTFWVPKTFDSYFLDMMYVEFMKNFLLARFERADGC